MKYGVLEYRRTVRPNNMNGYNLGDPIQSYALMNIYKIMGIDESQIVPVNKYKTKSYSGEYVVLPFNSFNVVLDQYKHKYDTLPVSEKIIPVFISFHLHSRNLSEEIIQQLKMYQPIGCRDEATMRYLRSLGIRSYLSGCITATLPRRQEEPKKQKIFFIDVPESVKKYIPQDMKADIEFVTHVPQFERLSDETYLTNEELNRFNETSINQLNRYRDEATLVVTSRLHAASPCMAMGIPVILVSENFDERFAWIDKYLPLYTEEKFAQIDWHPKPVEYELEKQRLIQMFSQQIKKAYEENSNIYSCSEFYESREKEFYNKGLIESLKQLNMSGNVEIALWGLRADTQNFYNVVKDHFKQWHISVIIDKNLEGYYEGIKIRKPEEIVTLNKDIVYFIIPEAAHDFAASYLSERNLKCILVKDKIKLQSIVKG